MEAKNVKEYPTNNKMLLYNYIFLKFSHRLFRAMKHINVRENLVIYLTFHITNSSQLNLNEIKLIKKNLTS